MALPINKRQQARNERTLQELLKLPGNDRCADCFTRNPGWASWDLGVFLCVRCASLHRKLGTHISKVKSLSMDSWSLEQVENMKKNGNIVSNRRYNPKQLKPHIPIDSDEVDGAMERFIREKYQHKTLCGEGRPLPSIKHHTGSSSGSSNDVPPPLPAKNGPRLSSTLRSSSAMFTSSQDSLPSPPASDLGSTGSRRMAGIPEDGLPSRDHSFDGKLDTLRSMGFPNESRNSTILKGASGDVSQAVQTLSRLGEGGGQLGPSVPKPLQTNGISFQSTGASQSSNGQGYQATSPQHAQSSSNSSNPFHRPPTAPQSTSPTSAPSFEQSFQSLSLLPQAQRLQQSQPLFPNNTGSWAASNTGAQSNPFLKTFTPPISPSPYQYTNVTPQQSTSNPFLRTSQSQTFASSNPFGTISTSQQPVPPVPGLPEWAPQMQQSQQSIAPQPQISMQTYQPAMSTSPHAMTPQDIQTQQNSLQQSYTQSSGPAQQSVPMSNPFAQPQQTNFFPGEAQQQQAHLQQQTDPYSQYSNTQQQQQQQQHQNQYQNQYQFQQPQQFHQPPQQVQQGYVEQRQFRDKNSILALYNAPSQHSQQVQQPQVAQEQVAPAPPVPQRSVTMPMIGNSSNPFGSIAPATMQQAAAPGHISRESMAFTGGRSASPDAFSGLSARWV